MLHCREIGRDGRPKASKTVDFDRFRIFWIGRNCTGFVGVTPSVPASLVNSTMSNLSESYLLPPSGQLLTSFDAIQTLRPREMYWNSFCSMSDCIADVAGASVRIESRHRIFFTKPCRGLECFQNFPWLTDTFLAITEPAPADSLQEGWHSSDSGK